MQPNIYDREIVSVTSESKWMSVMMILIGLWLFALAIIFPDPPENIFAQIGLRLLTAFFGLVTFVFIPRYKTSFRENNIVISVGYIQFIKVKIDRNKITHVGLIEWSPLRNFGGAGIKTGIGKFKNYWCFNYLGGTGIEIRTTERNYVIEMNDTERRRLVARIGGYVKTTAFKKN